MINHGYLAVDFFFLLSGFVIGYAYDDRWHKMSTSDFFKRRLIRLQPMVINGICYWCLVFLLSGFCFVALNTYRAGVEDAADYGDWMYAAAGAAIHG